MNKLIPLLVFSILLLVPLGAQNAYAQNDLFACSVFSDEFYELDPTDGSTISFQTLTLDGNSVDGCNGLATHPITGQTWIIAKVGFQAATVRTLSTIDTSTGAATSVGVLDDRFAGIAFAPNGDLIGITGDGANTPETLFTLDQTDASSTFLLALGAGDDGEAIAIDNECVLHHVSGFSNNNMFYERIDLVTLNVLFSGQQGGYAIIELASLVFNPSTQRLFAGDIDASFYDMTTNGVGTLLGFSEESMKGLAFAQPFAGLPIDADCDGDLDAPVGGELLFVDSTALLLAGLQNSAIWMLPVLAGTTGIGAFYIKSRMNKE